MTEERAKDSAGCLVCDARVGASARNGVRIFGEAGSDGHLDALVGSVLRTNLTRETAHSALLCRKCYKLLTEFDDLEKRLAEIGSEMRKNYARTVERLALAMRVRPEEYSDHDYADRADERRLSAESDPEYRFGEDGGSTILPNGAIEYPTESLERVASEAAVEYVEQEEEEEEHEEEQEEAADIAIKTESTGDVSGTASPTSRDDKVSKASIKTEEELEEGRIVTREGTEYTCLLCPSDDERVVGDARVIVSHVRGFHDSRLYICDVCGADFKKRNELSVHMDDHVAKEEGDFQCEVCNRIFSNLRLFRIHKRIHYPQVKSWPCETCGKRYSSKNLLEEHTNTHTGTRPYVCENCGKDFASKYTYKAHAKTHEVRPRPFECSKCNKTFLSQQNLNQHERTHNGIKEYVCHQCGKAFGSHHNLEVHNIVHTGYKPYICRMCGKAFARKAEIRDHERTHTGEKPYQCEFCGATFSQRSNLQSHKRATHYNDKRYKCEDCGKGFKRRRLLDYHTKAAHTGERPYKCETCTATFVYPEHFKKHMRIHTGEKPYLCEVCGKAFNSRDNRNAHRFIHSDKKPYECLVCGMGFMRKPLLYAHMQTQGHLNDTIVVNQPRLTTEEDRSIDSPPQVQHRAILGETECQRLDGAELYVTEFEDPLLVRQSDGDGGGLVVENDGDDDDEGNEDEDDDEDNDEEDDDDDGEGAERGIYENEGASRIPTTRIVLQEGIGHDGQTISFEETEAIECKPNEIVQCIERAYTDFGGSGDDVGQTIVVPADSSDYKELVGEDGGQSSVRLVQIRIPSGTVGDATGWLSLVQNT